MANDTLFHLVELTFQRVQTYLFAVPRLRVMVGANAILGECVRGHWLGDGFDPQVDSLPLRAELQKSCWPDLGLSPGTFDRANDPLVSKAGWQDDVAEVARATGVLVRDGGHFAAIFPSAESVAAFLDEARELLAEKLPGILLKAETAVLSSSGATYKKGPSVSERRAVGGRAILDLPQAEVCQYSGREPAQIKRDVAGESVSVSDAVAARIERGEDFDRGSTHDVLGILRPHLLEKLDLPPNTQAFPASFQEISTTNYLAIVHIDGNRVGSRIRDLKEKIPSDQEDFFGHWGLLEAMLHSLRVGLRKAVCEAVKNVFRDQGTQQNKVPLRLLMLGGDDLTLVCEATLALPFVCELARQVRETTRQLEGGELTLGAGVAIVQDSFPFYRAYDLAEQLTRSAKRLAASIGSLEDGNVVDWIITSEGWHGDIETTRRENSLRDGNLILSNKPYRILKSSDPDRRWSLEQLLEDACKLVKATLNNRFARSHLNALARALPEGRHSGCFAAKLLAREAQAMLNDYLDAKDGPWISVRGNTAYLTRLLDLWEVYELDYLKQSRTRAATEHEVASSTAEASP